MSQKSIKCDACGCACRRCSDSANLHLHVEIENLKQRLLEREHHIVSMETNFLREAEKFPNGELAAITEELLTWQNKYSRLYEAHKRVQKVNQNLEDKLLRIVDKCETEKNTLTSEVASLTRRLVDEKFNVSRLRDENDRYRNDVNTIIQFLHCKPSNFMPQKYDTLPMDLQQKVKNYIKIPDSNRRLSLSDGNGNIHNKSEMKTIKVPIPTFPPTAMVYSVNKGPADKEINHDERMCRPAPVDIVSAAIMAKVLEEREKERMQTKHCESCTCPVLSTTQSKCTQTDSTESIEKCFCVNQLGRKDGKCVTGRSSSPMSVRGKVLDVKQKDSEFSLLAKERVNKRLDKISAFKTNQNKQLGKIEADLDRLAQSRARKIDDKLEKVEEAILINIDQYNEDNDSGIGKLLSGDEDWPPCGESPTEADSLISFESKVSKPSGPRHCSVRVQAGTSNILLDNVVDPYTPILYKSRYADPLVHQRSRSASSASSSDEALNKKVVAQLRTETQI